MITTEDVKLYRKFQRSPIFFIKTMWGLIPQPLKEDYKDIAKSVPLKDYKAHWFKPFIKGKHITWQQWVILLAVEKGLRGEASKRITVKSGHGIGKDTTLSWAILWFLFCFEDAQVPCTAPSREQLHDILWKECKIWLDRMPERASKLYEWRYGYIRMKEAPETWFARARTAKKEAPEALSGVHGDHVLFGIDEGSGVHDEIFNTAEGALTGPNVLILMISNPTRLIGYFYDSHHADAHNWQNLSFDSEESPIVDWDYVDRIEEKHGRGSDEWRKRVSGKFPKEDSVDDQGYVPLLTKADIKEVEDADFIGERKMGIDPAGAGRDKTEWLIRDSFKAKSVLTEKKSTPKTIAQKTLTLMTHHYVDPGAVWIDNFGEGANVAVEIALAQPKYKTNPVSFGDRNCDVTFLNKRAEMYWRIKDWFRTGGAIVKDVELKKQLLSIRYREELSGKIKIMSKREMKKLSISSPDIADALALTFFEDEVDNETPDYSQPKRGDKLRMAIRKTRPTSKDTNL